MKQLKTELSRRNVLRGFGAGAVAGVGASVSKAGKLAGVSVDSLTNGVEAADPLSGTDNTMAIGKMLKLTGGIPDFKLDELWQDAKYVHGLDLDLASHVSTSLSARVAMQRKRGFERRKKNYLLSYDLTKHAAQLAFKKLHGIEYM